MPSNKKEVKDTLERYDTKEKDKEWNSMRRSQTTMQFFPNRKDCQKISARKEVCWEIAQLVTAHCNLNSYLHMIGKKESPECACGNEEENVWHFIFECDKYDHIKDIGYSKLWDVKDLHGFIKDDIGFQVLEKFITSSKRFNGR